MKKQLNVLLISLSVFFLSGCFGTTTTNENIEDAKNELLNNSGSSTIGDENIPKYESGGIIDNTGATITEGKAEEEEEKIIVKENYTVKYLGTENFIEIDNLDKTDFAGRKVEIKGTVLSENVDKIIINFSNSSSSFPDDRYRLAQFNKGDKDFIYRAFSQYQTLDYGTNEYIIEAYSGNEVSRVEIVINISKPGEKIDPKDNTTTEKISVDKEEDKKQDFPSLTSLDLTKLPKSTDYGNPENLGDGKIGYSGVDNLKIKMLDPSIVIETSDEINSFLIDNVAGWFFWNSFKPGNTSTSVYVIRLNGDKYIYEKHYYLANGMYGVLQLETGSGVDRENINAANLELKEKNGEFDTLKADKLFKDLSK